MTQQDETAARDAAWIALVKGTAPRATGDDEARAAARMAVLAGRARSARRRRMRQAIAAGVGALALAAAAVIALVVTPGAPVPERAVATIPPPVPAAPPATSDERLRTTVLSAGDVVHASAETVLAIAHDDGVRRDLRLTRGTVLFDVRSVPSGSFEVHTPGAVVRVLGTVFRVDVGARGTSVEVFEGRVERRDGERHVVLATGEHDGEASAPDACATLARIGTRLADERAQHATASRRVRAPASIELAPAELAPAAPAVEEHAEGAPAPASSSDDPRAWRARILGGQAEGVLEEARARHGSVWRSVEGDSLRALARHGDAARAYERAAEEATTGTARIEATYLAARELLAADAPTEALRVLEAQRALDEPSPLRERCHALALDAATRAGLEPRVRALATEYLERFPEGPAAATARRVGEAR